MTAPADYYHDHCRPHGTFIGDPYGADIMCGLCEQGLTRWVDEPYYALRLYVGNIPTGKLVTWYGSDLDDPDSLDALWGFVRRWADMVEMAHAEDPDITMQVDRLLDGYWDYPVPAEESKG